MKDSEFIELLNLYVDHEISATDAARLEAEVHRNPEHRRVYQDYCRMQKACRMLAEDFATEPVDGKKVAAFEQAQADRFSHRRQWYAAGSLAAAAACVAAVFAVHRGQSPAAPQSSDFAAATPAVTRTVTDVAPAAVIATAAPRDPELRATSPLSIRNSTQTDALAIATRQTDPQFVWMQKVRLTPIQQPVEQLRLDVMPTNRTDDRTYSSRQPLPRDIEWTAIRFQK